MSQPRTRVDFRCRWTSTEITDVWTGAGQLAGLYCKSPRRYSSGCNDDLLARFVRDVIDRLVCRAAESWRKWNKARESHLVFCVLDS